jgi:hypothetical protein
MAIDAIACGQATCLSEGGRGHDRGRVLGDWSAPPRRPARSTCLPKNCCYFQPVMLITNMVAKGLFGELTYAECGYVHDCRSLMFEGRWHAHLARRNAPRLFGETCIRRTPSARWPNGWTSTAAIAWVLVGGLGDRPDRTWSITYGAASPKTTRRSKSSFAPPTRWTTPDPHRQRQN